MLYSDLVEHRNVEGRVDRAIGWGRPSALPWLSGVVRKQDIDSGHRPPLPLPKASRCGTSSHVDSVGYDRVLTFHPIYRHCLFLDLRFYSVTRTSYGQNAKSACSSPHCHAVRFEQFILTVKIGGPDYDSRYMGRRGRTCFAAHRQPSG